MILVVFIAGLGMAESSNSTAKSRLLLHTLLSIQASIDKKCFYSSFQFSKSAREREKKTEKKRVRKSGRKHWEEVQNCRFVDLKKALLLAGNKNRMKKRWKSDFFLNCCFVRLKIDHSVHVDIVQFQFKIVSYCFSPYFQASFQPEKRATNCFFSLSLSLTLGFFHSLLFFRLN